MSRLIPPWREEENVESTGANPRATVWPSKRRHVHPPVLSPQLSPTNPIHPIWTSGQHVKTSLVPDKTAKQSTAPKGDDERVLAGISLQGWKVGTSQGPIGDSEWFEQATTDLEAICQYKSNNEQQRRQLVLPEMVFPHAHVILEYQDEHHKHPLTIAWTARDCLIDWAKAHQAIPLPGSEDEESDETATSTKSYGRGVSVLKSSDASLWKAKRKEQIANPNSQESQVRTTTFHYDWTFSSPYTGRMETTTNTDWKVCENSAMPMHLLTDQSVPILYFDSLNLLEDDLHDNGQMQYTVKLRVMPTCVYVLSQLFVRVDYVLVRLKETRFLVHFAKRQFVRDITWRECEWGQLEGHGLPMELKAWTTPNEQPQQAAAFAQLLQRLPQVPLPDDMLPHATMSYS